MKRQGHVAVETEIFHIINSFKKSKFGVICYVSDNPLKGLTLDKMPESYIGWRIGVQSLIELLNKT